MAIMPPDPLTNRKHMLYLVRKIGESIIINDDIEIQVTEVRGKAVKLGIQFPKNATVLRKELFEKIQSENKAASQDTAGMWGRLFPKKTETPGG